MNTSEYTSFEDDLSSIQQIKYSIVTITWILFITFIIVQCLYYKRRNYTPIRQRNPLASIASSTFTNLTVFYQGYQMIAITFLCKDQQLINSPLIGLTFTITIRRLIDIWLSTKIVQLQSILKSIGHINIDEENPKDPSTKNKVYEINGIEDVKTIEGHRTTEDHRTTEGQEKTIIKTSRLVSPELTTDLLWYKSWRGSIKLDITLSSIFIIFQILIFITTINENSTDVVPACSANIVSNITSIFSIGMVIFITWKLWHVIQDALFIIFEMKINSIVAFIIMIGQLIFGQIFFDLKSKLIINFIACIMSYFSANISILMPLIKSYFMLGNNNIHEDLSITHLNGLYGYTSRVSNTFEKTKTMNLHVDTGAHYLSGKLSDVQKSPIETDKKKSTIQLSKKDIRKISDLEKFDKGLETLTEYLKKEYNIENIFFYTDVKEYQKSIDLDDSEIKELNMAIYTRYIKADALYQINLPFGIHHEILAMIMPYLPLEELNSIPKAIMTKIVPDSSIYEKSKFLKMYDKGLLSIIHLLQSDVLPRFLQSKIFLDFVANK